MTTNPSNTRKIFSYSYVYIRSKAHHGRFQRRDSANRLIPFEFGGSTSQIWTTSNLCYPIHSRSSEVSWNYRTFVTDVGTSVKPPDDSSTENQQSTNSQLLVEDEAVGRQRRLRPPLKQSWDENYNALKEFVVDWKRQQRKDAKSKTVVSLQTPPLPDTESLREWLERQRGKLRQYQAHNDSPTPESKQQDNNQLSNENDKIYDATTELSDSSEESLTDQIYLERIKKLNDLGYSIHPRIDYWEKRYEHLIQFAKKHNGRFPHDMEFHELDPDDKLLYYWCQKQKAMYREYHAQQEKSVSTDTKRTDTDSDSDPGESDTDDENDDIRHTSVTDDSSDDDDDETVDGSGSRIRPRRKLSALSSTNVETIQQRIQRLEAIGFVWNNNDKKWIQMYNKLRNYYKHHGNCLVPKRYVNNPQLAKWVDKQRSEYALYMKNQQSSSIPTTSPIEDSAITVETVGDGVDPKEAASKKNYYYTSMTPERIERLNEIEFEWNALNAKWMKKYNQLAQYVEIAGLGQRPGKRKVGTLYEWVRHQERIYAHYYTNHHRTSATTETATDDTAAATRTSSTSTRKLSNTLTPERIELLQRLGFLLD